MGVVEMDMDFKAETTSVKIGRLSMVGAHPAVR